MTDLPRLVRLPCSACGVTAVDTAVVTQTVAYTNGAEGREPFPVLSGLSFSCPRCGEANRVPLTERFARETLRSSRPHLDVRFVHVPAEVVEAHPEGELTADFVLDAVAALRRDPWFAG